MRTKSVIRNFIVSIVGQLFITLSNFFTRWIFVQILPIEYLGINGLFINILTLLSFADLGLGLSASYYLYDPLVKKDERKIVHIICYYKKVYSVIGCIVLVAGIIMLPAVKYITKGCTIDNIQIIYILYIINASFSYLSVHKVTLLSADQKKYISSMYTNGIKILQFFLSTIVIVMTENYIAYYSVQILATVVTNYLISKKVDTMYPFIKNIVCSDQGKEVVEEIKSNMGAMLFHKFASVVVNGTDNILISSFISITMVGIYTNYTLILNSVANFLSLFLELCRPVLEILWHLRIIKRKRNFFIHYFFWIFGYVGSYLFVYLYY